MRKRRMPAVWRSVIRRRYRWDKGVGVGAGSVADRALVQGTGNIATGSQAVPYNTADKSLLGAVSVGSSTVYRQITNVADGTQDQDVVTLRQLRGALSIAECDHDSIFPRLFGRC